MRRVRHTAAEVELASLGTCVTITYGGIRLVMTTADARKFARALHRAALLAEREKAAMLDACMAAAREG